MKKNYFYKFIQLMLLILICVISSIQSFAKDDILKTTIEQTVYKRLDSQEVTGFTFNELKKLSTTYKPEGELKEKLDAHLAMVFVVNRLYDSKLERPYVRVGHWNAERGYHLSQIKDILLNPNKFQNNYINNVKKRHRKDFIDELENFHNVDIISFNELDIGMPRTDYRNNVKEIADELGWNYAYTTEFVEVGPLFQMLSVDEQKYQGLHGTVLLSRFPILKAEKIVLPQFYDWYKSETKKRTSPVEYGRRFLASTVFREKLDKREVRHGGRNVIIADIELPNKQVITVVTTHFEDRAYCDGRLRQFKALLDSIKDKKTPIVLTGDFNTSTTDTKPTSLNKEIFKRMRDPDFIMRSAASIAVPGAPVASGFASVTVSKLLQYKDPFYPHIPIIFPNHERKFYAALKDFKFSDGTTFDLNGDKDRSFRRKKGLLANSNQRHWKGFKSTYRLEEPRLIAYFKLDWFFIKPVNGLFKPFNGRTLKTLNLAIKGGISDHNPITVDIELENNAAEKIMKTYHQKREEERKKS